MTENEFVDVVATRLPKAAAELGKALAAYTTAIAKLMGVAVADLQCWTDDELEGYVRLALAEASRHKYITHSMYTGFGCAVCGKSLEGGVHEKTT